jgi:sulfur carrier protein ThiS
MAEIVEDTPEVEENEPQEQTQEELVANLGQPEPEAITSVDPEAAPEEELPDKYKGKSIKDVVEMHQSAEKLLGSHSSEVGELRKLVDTYITGQLSETKATTEESKEPEVDFFDDPNVAVNQAIENHPAVQRANQASAQMEQQAALSTIHAKHPDMGEVLQDPSFAEWIKGSPVRTELFQRADQRYDVDAADELLSTYKERMGAVQQTLVDDQQVRKETLKAAATGSSSGSGAGPTAKVYRRADIIKLMKTDPDRYDQLAPEISKAYQEGRVR